MSTTDYAGWQLLKFCEEVYIPAHRDKWENAEETGPAYVRSCRDLCEMRGRPVFLYEIDEPTLEEYLEYLKRAGRAHGTAAHRIYNVKRVVRYAIHPAFPKQRKPAGEKSRKWDGELKDYFERMYRPSKLRGGKISSIEAYRRVIRRFSEFLDRPSGFKDLTQENVQRFQAVSNVEYLRRLVSLWRYAAIQGHAEYPTYSVPQPRAVEVRHQRVAGYFEETYLPARIAAADLAPSSMKSYRYAIGKFDHFCGSNSKGKIVNVTPSRLRVFRDWLVDTGINPRKAKTMVEVVRQVCKDAYPEGWLPKLDRTAEEKLSDDALLTVFKERLLPTRPGMKATTIGQYERILARFSRYLGHTATLGDLTDQQVGGFVKSILDEGRSVRTANGYRSKILSLWNWCAKKRLLKLFPDVPKLAEPEQIPTAWSADDMRKLRRACDDMPGDVKGIPAAKWWLAHILVAWDGGERTGAILNMRWEWINLEKAQLVIPAEARKGGTKAMYYQLKPATVEALRAIREPLRELVFPTKVKDPGGWYYPQYRLLLKFAGLPYVPWKSGLQKIRRTFASHIEAAGGNATKALAHSSRALTEKSYLDPRIVGTPPSNELLFDLG